MNKDGGRFWRREDLGLILEQKHALVTGGLAWAITYHVPHADYLNRLAAKINFLWTQEFMGSACLANTAVSSPHKQFCFC